MKDVSQRLMDYVHVTALSLAKLSDSQVSQKPHPSKWSKKEILGHLIDSASNNHHRFVRMQIHAKLAFPDYEQPQWVTLNRYQERSWNDLVGLWKAYNEHLAHVIAHIDSGALANTWERRETNEVCSLEFVASDYIVHMKHHIEQILR